MEGAATTRYKTCCVGATGVVARRLEKVGGDRDGTAGDWAGVAGDHAAAAGRKAGDAGGILAAGGWVGCGHASGRSCGKRGVWSGVD